MEQLFYILGYAIIWLAFTYLWVRRFGDDELVVMWAVWPVTLPAIIVFAIVGFVIEHAEEAHNRAKAKAPLP